MREHKDYTPEELRYLRLLAQQYPTVRAAGTEIINLQAILNLPKGCEHFISDVHGEHEAFLHILNSCSGVVRERMDLLFRIAVHDQKRLRPGRNRSPESVKENQDCPAMIKWSSSLISTSSSASRTRRVRSSSSREGAGLPEG